MACTLCIVPVMPVRMPSRISGLGGGGVSVRDNGGMKHLAIANTLARRTTTITILQNAESDQRQQRQHNHSQIAQLYSPPLSR